MTTTTTRLPVEVRTAIARTASTLTALTTTAETDARLYPADVGTDALRHAFYTGKVEAYRTAAALVEAMLAAFIEPDQHGNRTAEEGESRCQCGSKYWERDRCADCGTKHDPTYHDQETNR